MMTEMRKRLQRSNAPHTLIHQRHLTPSFTTRRDVEGFDQCTSTVALEQEIDRELKKQKR